MFSRIRPYQWVAIRLPSDTIKVEQMVPNATISLGKFGSFRTNQVIDRPFHLTWEILEKSSDRLQQELRIVKAPELYAETLLEEAESDIAGGNAPIPEFDEYGLMNGDKSNVNILDDPANQKLGMDEIEALKADALSNPRDLITKIMVSHSSLDQKTAFSLAKYILRKRKKFMKQFTIFPLDVGMMVDWMMNERDMSKIMELRNECIGLVGSWANVHAAGIVKNDETASSPQACRYLVVDDTGGLVVAAIAERMGILHHHPDSLSSPTTETEAATVEQDETTADNPSAAARKRRRLHEQRPLPRSNTIHLVHAKSEPNLSLLKYFNYDTHAVSAVTDNYPPHPLYSHLKTLSWLQLVDPQSDAAYQEPPEKSPEELHAMKTNLRSAYYRKRRRWQRCKSTVDETRAGGFDGLVIASHTSPLSILHHLVPLLTGGAQIVVYHPYIEPLTEVFDAYAMGRRTAFFNLEQHEREEQIGSSRFPVDPTLTLGFTLQTARAKKWQVLPGRTHPVMIDRGGAEGYIASATRVVPLKGKINARGSQLRKTKRNGTVIEVDTPSVLEQNSSSEDDHPERKRIKSDSAPTEMEVQVQVQES